MPPLADAHVPSQTGRLVWVMIAAIATVLIGIYYLFLYVTTSYVPPRLRVATTAGCISDLPRRCQSVMHRPPGTSVGRTAAS